MWWPLVLAVVIPPGHEAAISKLLRDTSLPDGCRVTDVRVQSDRIEAPLACPSASPRLQLFHPQSHLDRPRTPHFAVRVIGDAPDGLDARIAHALAPHDEIDVWARPATRARPQLTTSQSTGIALLLALWPLAEFARWRRRRSRRTETASTR